MTQPPSLPLPPFGDATDEALNAHLDGELGAFAAEHDLTEADARERLERWPEYGARIDALERVRAAVRAPVPPLDDLTRRRLVRHALPGTAEPSRSSPRSGRSWLRITAAAAAALILLAGVGAVINSVATNNGAVESSRGGGAASVADAPPRGDLGDLGDVSDPAQLQALLDPDLDQGTNNQFRAESSVTTGPLGGSKTNDAGGDASALAPPVDGLAKRDAAGAVTPEACAAQLAGARPVQFVATGTYQGRPVVIVGLDVGGRTIASVVPDNDCTTVLTSISR